MNDARRILMAAALSCCLLLGVGAASGQQPSSRPLTVYTYSSFVSFGAADVVAQAFQEQTGAQIQFVATGDSRTMLAKLIAEREATGQAPADVFIGVEVNDLAIAQRNDLFLPLTLDDVPELADVPLEIRFDPEQRLIPYEHGFITLVYDSQRLREDQIPRTFEDLLDPKFRQQLIVEDPRTSSPGLSFLLWTIHRFGDPGYLDFWRGLLPNILTITPSWDAAFDLFLRGEAPLVVSFSTDHAYDVIVNRSERIQVLTPQGEAYRTIFGMGVVKGSKQPELAKRFLTLMLSPEVQSQLAETEWMIPANVNAKARVIWWQNLVLPSTPVLLPVDVVSSNLDRWIDQWVRGILSR
jgi:thiamine transport system substrate-binding protein